MQYVRSLAGSASNTWNSINPATLSGAVDVIVVEQEDGSLACSPFHVRFGKWQLLRPFGKKVVFTVNEQQQDFAMKLGEGGEAYFVFETSESIPTALQASPLVSPATSPNAIPSTPPPELDLTEPDPLDLSNTSPTFANSLHGDILATRPSRALTYGSDQGPVTADSMRPHSGDWSGRLLGGIERSNTDEILPSTKRASAQQFGDLSGSLPISSDDTSRPSTSSGHPPIPTFNPTNEAMTRAINLSKKLWSSNVPTQVTEKGDLMLDMTGYKSNEEQAIRAEKIARELLSEDMQGNYDIGSLIGLDHKGNVWIYGSEEAKEAASKATTKELTLQEKLHGLQPAALRSTDALSDPGYHSDDNQSEAETVSGIAHQRRDSDSAVGMSSAPHSPDQNAASQGKTFAKTLRLTSDQLKTLDLHPGPNSMSFTVNNKATCQAFIYLWSCKTPVVISDIDGTITKSDVLGHVLNSIGRDWTHQGVAKLYTDIASNGFNIFYLTSRSIGQADTTRAYLNSVVQEGFRLPKGPVIMSPDRTMAALRREVYLRKPEVFKMGCLRDIKDLFAQRETPFYAGFGNRFTDALSYRSVSIPQQRIFTINSNAQVTLDLLSLHTYTVTYVSMRELVDHYFPSVSLLIKEGGEEFTDFNHWRSDTLAIDEFSASESSASLDAEEDDDDDDDDDDNLTARSDDEYGENELEASYISRDSIDESSIMESVEGDEYDDEQDEMGASLVIETTADSVRAVVEVSARSRTDGVVEAGSAASGGDEGDGTPMPTATTERSLDLQHDLGELAQVLNSPERRRRVSQTSVD